MCVSYSQRDCKVMEESAIKALPSHYSICPSQLKYQMKKFCLKADMSGQECCMRNY